MNRGSSTLVKLLSYAVGDENERKNIKFEDTHIRQLLGTESIEGTTLVQEEVFKTVLAGAEPFVCLRDVLPNIKVKSNSLRYVVGDGSNNYASVVAEGAEIPVYTQNYSSRTFTISKIGTRPLITRELVEDSLFDVIEVELKKAGARIENKLNRDALNMLITNANKSYQASADALTVAQLAKAVSQLRDAGYVPDTLLLEPILEGYLFADSNLIYANYAGSDETLRTGKVSTLLGMQVYTLGVTQAATNNSWQWSGTTGDVGAIVMDSKNAGAIAIRDDIQVERYDDPIRDLAGVSVTMRYGVQVLQPDAICVVKRA